MTTKTPTKSRARKPNQGMNWIRLSTRMSIYARDGFSCVYCQSGVEDEHGRGLTLDHVQPCELGGTNSPSNLVTCCNSCNSSKQDVPLRLFIANLPDGTGARRRVRNAQRRKLDRKLGQRLARARKTAND